MEFMEILLLMFVGYGGVVTWLTQYYKNKGIPMPPIVSAMVKAKDMIEDLQNGGEPEDYASEPDEDVLASIVRNLFDTKKKLVEADERIATLENYHK